MGYRHGSIDAEIIFKYFCPECPDMRQVTHIMDYHWDTVSVDGEWGECDIDILCPECNKYHTIEVI